MKTISVLRLFLAFFLSGLPSGAVCSDAAFNQLAASGEAALPGAQPPASPGQAVEIEAEQYLPPDNDAPGFDWDAGALKSAGPASHFFRTDPEPATLLSSPWDQGKVACELAQGAHYEITAPPAFYGEYIKVRFLEPQPGCGVMGGFVRLPSVAASSAGGLCELPPTVRAFLDTLAYAEGTGWHYNYIYSFATFEHYGEHPARRICSGGLCSTAAGRYQFLSKTWAGLAADLGLTDFSPPSQDKACLEIIRREGAYGLVLGSDNFDNFSAALSKLNRIWASAGQPLWPAYP